MKYLRLFNSHSEYTNPPTDLLGKKFVSYCKELNEVHYDIIDPYNGYDYVDLGLPSGTKWATMNVGASSEKEVGLYFAWGETQGYTASQVGTGTRQKAFDWADYKYGNGTETSMTKYNSSDGKILLEAEDDAAAVNMGGDWHMPTKEQCIELYKQTKNGYVTNAGAFTQYAWNDSNGYSSPTQTTAEINGWDTAGYFFFKSDVSDMDAAITSGDYLFVPAAGICSDGGVLGVGELGSVYASTLNSESGNSNSAWSFYFASDEAYVYNSGRCSGLSVRGVAD